eukprot:GFUD01029061.1.p1 GENE.GFUD01029061.1~~GFUD01029061.1.p1  ORF type:complete len:100 (+),score=9.69 GFUD01029061.1:255-554(+)
MSRDLATILWQTGSELLLILPVSKHSLISFSNAKLISPAGPTQVQLEDRIVNPDLRDHSLPGPIVKSCSSSILDFWCNKFNQLLSTFNLLKMLVRKTSF